MAYYHSLVIRHGIVKLSMCTYVDYCDDISLLNSVNVSMTFVCSSEFAHKSYSPPSRFVAFESPSLEPEQIYARDPV